MKTGYLMAAVLMGIVFAAQPAFAGKGIAFISATQEGSNVNGEAVLNETKDGGLEIEVKVANVPPGNHAFHIHEKGDCGDHGNAAGGHFNPNNTPHGLVTKDGLDKAHCGDFGNIEVGPDGTGSLKFTAPGLTLTGDSKYNVEGKAFILHEKADDFGQPTGNAGARIGCGMIMLQDESDSRVQSGIPDKTM